LRPPPVLHPTSPISQDQSCEIWDDAGNPSGNCLANWESDLRSKGRARTGDYFPAFVDFEAVRST